MPYRYIITDSRDNPLARGYLNSEPTAEIWEIRVLDDAIDHVLDHEMIHLIGLDEDAPAKSGRILRRRGDCIALEPLTTLGIEVRQNLRVSVEFESFIYPVNDDWKGRLPIVCHDLSCGGIAFFCENELQPGEIVDAVIGAVEPPLILKTQVIRERPSNMKYGHLYAAKYLDLTSSEESAVREAVFGIQIRDA